MEMKDDCNILNPLKRDGVSQRQRLVRALHPSYVSVDERELKDYLLYARQYAQLLRYFSPSNHEDGNWQIFIENDISTLTAIIADTNLNQYRTAFNNKIAAINGMPLANRWAELSDLFSLVFALPNMANKWIKAALAGLQLNTELDKIIGAIINDAFVDARNLAARCNQVPLIQAGGLITIPNATQFSAPWNLPPIQPDLSYFPDVNAPSEEELDILIVALQKIYKKIYDALLSIVSRGEEFLDETLTNYPQHTPHITLFLAFICIFKIARDHLNTLTRRHLNFYYRDVLGLVPNPAQPDQVHMVFELAKNFETHRVTTETPLKAGKDANGANMFFDTDEELIVNKTTLADHGLKAIFIDKEIDNDNYIIKNIHAAPIANSADGIGADIEEEDGKWLTFGNTSTPDATVGFAIASPIFLLKEGTRTITTTLNFEKDNALDWGAGISQTNPVAQELKHNLQVYYSGEKEWHSINIKEVEVNLAIGTVGQIILTIELNAGDAPFTYYDDENLKDGFKTSHPLLKIVLDNDGLSADYLCMDAISPAAITSKNEFEEKVPDFIQEAILKFLNAAQTWEDIAGVEPVDGPVLDAPGTGPGTLNTAHPDYDIGQDTAEKILGYRGLIGGEFEQTNELFAIPGLGLDKLKDLFYTFCAANITEFNIGKVKAEARPFDTSLNYSKNDLVEHNDQWYKAIVPSQGFFPSPDSNKWQLLAKSYPYQYFQQLNLTSIDLQVNVSGMTDLILENDIGTLNPSKPFQPFGPIPKVGSKFYIGNFEVFQKSLDSISLDLVWADLPEESWNAYYNNYLPTNNGSNLTGTHPVSDNHHFTMTPKLLINGEWSNTPIIPSTAITLFNNSTNDPEADKGFLLNFNNHYEKYDLDPFSNISPDLPRGFIRFELLQDFLHKKYPRFITRAALAQKPAWIPNEPYTPIVESIRLTYQSSQTINYQAQFKSDYDDRVEQIFHIEPFGWKEFFPVPNALSDKTVFVSRKIVPEFLVTQKDPATDATYKTDAEGTLYVGLNNLNPEQNVSILFQVAEGSADPELATQPVIWSYLSYNRWIDFDIRAILSDSTNGLLQSGIIKFVMPKIMSNQNTSLPASTFWIKASVANHTAAVSKAIAVIPQAVKATFDIETNNDLDRLSSALPAETIAKLVNRQAAIKKVKQPYASFGGKIAERVEAPAGVTGEAIFNKDYNEFYIRISERLRHGNRGVTMWDYERMVLQKFPDIYKVKCINHTRLSHPDVCSPEHAPGHVKVIVLPNLRNKNAVDPLRPMVSKSQLENIHNFLRNHISDFVHLEVRNPIFERIQVEFQVRFKEGFDKGFYTGQLQQDILKFLSPWLYDEGEDLAVGGKVHRSTIINFIEETAYVDFLTDFKMNQIIFNNDGSQKTIQDVEEAIATTSSSVLVSVPAIEHLIGDQIFAMCN